MSRQKIGTLYGDAQGAMIQTAWQPAWAPSRRQATLTVYTTLDGDQWRIAISRDPAIPAKRLPADCPLTTGRVFTGRYGASGSDDAETMPLAAIRRVIQECTTHYLLLLRQADLLDGPWPA